MDIPGSNRGPFDMQSTMLLILLKIAYIITQYAYIATRITRTITIFTISVDMNEVRPKLEISLFPLSDWGFQGMGRQVGR